MFCDNSNIVIAIYQTLYYTRDVDPQCTEAWSSLTSEKIYNLAKLQFLMFFFKQIIKI